MGRLSAIEVFPTLMRYPGFRPRTPRMIPIGNQSMTASENGPKHTQAHPEKVDSGLVTLYHDLGVLAFNGCTATQIEQIGSILQRVMAWGGISGLRIALRAAVTFDADVPSDFPIEVSLSESNRKNYGDYTSGQIALGAMKSCHEWALANHPLWGDVDPSAKNELMEKTTRLPVKVKSSRPGIHHETAAGTRRLPLRTHTLVKAYPSDELVQAITWISTKGKGDIVGMFRTQCQTRNDSWSAYQSRKKGFAAMALDYNEAARRERAMLAKESTDQADALQTAEDALEGLWKLERETWAERSNVITEEDRRAETEQTAKAEKRKPLMPVDSNASQPSEASRYAEGVKEKKSQWQQEEVENELKGFMNW